jgi:hypothetical protein
MPRPAQWRFRSHLDEYQVCTAVLVLVCGLMIWEHGWMVSAPDQLCLWFSVGVVVGALGFGACYAALPVGDRAAADVRRKRRRAPHWLILFALLLQDGIMSASWHRPFGPLYQPALIGFTLAALLGYPWYHRRWFAAKTAYERAVATVSSEALPVPGQS